MKVICISDKESNLTKDKKYEAVEASVAVGGTMYTITDDNGNKKNFLQSKFITFFKFRLQRVQFFTKKI